MVRGAVVETHATRFPSSSSPLLLKALAGRAGRLVSFRAVAIAALTGSGWPLTCSPVPRGDWSPVVK